MIASTAVACACTYVRTPDPGAVYLQLVGLVYGANLDRDRAAQAEIANIGRGTSC